MKQLVAAVGVSLLLVSGAFAQTATQPAARAPTAMTDTQIKQALEQQGYSNVTVQKHDKGHVDVMASKGGQNQRLAVDPMTGQATPDKD